MRRVAVLAVLLGCRAGSPAASAVTPPATSAAAPATIAVSPVTATADRDNDGVLDLHDRCPDEPEDRDDFEDADGCVDRDNDRDGVLDAHEWKDGRWTSCDFKLENGDAVDCRDQPEDRDGFEDLDGCPDVFVICCGQSRLGTRLYLDTRGRLDAGAPRLLDEVAADMQLAPNARFAVEAHVDDRRDDAAARRLTQRIADETVAALVARGVARERLEPRGLGDHVPIARNDNKDGRRANRRVEFVLRDVGCEPLPPTLRPALGLDPLPPPPDFARCR